MRETDQVSIVLTRPTALWARVQVGIWYQGLGATPGQPLTCEPKAGRDAEIVEDLDGFENAPTARRKTFERMTPATLWISD